MGAFQNQPRRHGFPDIGTHSLGADVGNGEGIFLGSADDHIGEPNVLSKPRDCSLSRCR
jgi:hypothetical protein